MRVFLLAFVFAAIALANAEFLVGNSTVGGKMPILCEGETEVFVSQPDGEVAKLALDGYSQAEFPPKMAGPHTVQCGKHTIVAYASQENDSAGAVNSGGEFFATLALLVLLAGFFIATFLAAKFFFLDRTEFLKNAGNGKVEINLRTAKKMENLVVEDPVCVGYAGGEKRFRIGTLEPGRSWKCEYEIDGWEPARALPASLSATQQGRAISLLSGLFIEGRGKNTGEKLSAEAGKKAYSEKRRLPKAPA
ncbi:MAG: hypothetical protein QW568_03375 [Candidatus Anstonellaceae archaeon]